MKAPTRRAVIVGAGAAAAIGSGFAFARSRGRGQRRIGYAVVGLGGYATRQIMPNFRNCRHARLTALVSGTPDKLVRYGEEYGIPPTHRYGYADFDRIRDNPDIDVVYVVLPNSMHAEYSIRAAQAGKHVMCEKPMAISVAECEAMIAACRAAGTRLMIGYRSRFEPHNIAAIDMARSSALGPTRLIEAVHGFTIQPGQWRLDRPLSGGGSLIDIGIYSVNAARYLTGEEPVEVMATESTDRDDERFRTVEDRITAGLRFPSGIIASVVSSYSSGHNRYRVTGTRGWRELEPATPYSGHAMRVNRDGETRDEQVPALDRNQFAGQLDHLAECVIEGREPIVPGEEGLADMRVIEAMYRSARERRAVRLA